MTLVRADELPSRTPEQAAMPSTDDPVSNRSEKKATGIYIARGNETLGPYNPAEAAALVVGGYLHADDFAARNGDSAWVPLAEFLPPGWRDRPVKADPAGPAAAAPPPEAHPPRWRRLAVAVVLLAAVPLLAAGVVRWLEGRRPVRPVVAARPSLPPSPPPTATPAATPAPTPVVVSTPVATPTPPPPTPEPDGPLHGSLSAPLAGVRVAAYPLDTLETALAPTLVSARAARERLDPQITAAATEHTARVAEEQASLRALNDAAPNDPLRRSLRFAYNGAKAATRTATDNERFLLDERATAAGSDAYIRTLPAPAITAETDAAGNFSLDLPADGQSYVVAASVPQKADDGSTHLRGWLVRLSSAQRSGRATLRLDDGNAMTSASDDSLVHAVN